MLFKIVYGPVRLTEDGPEGAGGEAAMHGDDHSPLTIAVLGMAATSGDVDEAASLQRPDHRRSRKALGNGRSHAARRTSMGAVITSVTSGAGASSK